MSTWFSASAVIPQLELVWSLTATSKAWLTIAVQLGFVAGALVSASLNIADLIAPRFVIAAGGIGAGAANLALVVADSRRPASPSGSSPDFAWRGCIRPPSS